MGEQQNVELTPNIVTKTIKDIFHFQWREGGERRRVVMGEGEVREEGSHGGRMITKGGFIHKEEEGVHKKGRGA